MILELKISSTEHQCLTMVLYKTLTQKTADLQIISANSPNYQSLKEEIEFLEKVWLKVSNCRSINELPILSQKKQKKSKYRRTR